MKCKVCQGSLKFFTTGSVLKDITAVYDRCGHCGMVSARDPHWLDTAYSSAIASTDLGLLSRSLILSRITAAVMRSERLRTAKCLDWAGGYGTLTRLMRDRGFDFFHYDPMATNLHAVGFEADLTEQFTLITAIEVLEHLPDPVGQLAPVAKQTRLMLATTEVLPHPTPLPNDWWYYTPETGQHISFYTRSCLGELGKQLGFASVVSGRSLHLFHDGSVSAATRRLIKSPKVAYALGTMTGLADRRHSLLEKDVRHLLGRQGSPDS